MKPTLLILRSVRAGTVYVRERLFASANNVRQVKFKQPCSQS
jgi:hypothetical protein